jgi:6-phosphogluconate dehydrogenase
MDLHAIVEAWRSGSVVRSWLLDLIADGLAKDPQLDQIRGYVEDTGEGRWTVDTASTAPSRQMMRQQFGGHAVRAAEPVAPR